MAHTDIPDALAKIEVREKNVPWYNPDISRKLGDSARELLENYSRIPSAEVEDHVYKIVCFCERACIDSQLTSDDSATMLGTSFHIHVSVVSDFLTCESSKILSRS
jgi:hypothetical protein